MLETSKLAHFDPPLTLGEGPIYRFDDHTLHFNDFGSKKVHIVPVNPETDEVDTTRPRVTHDTSDHISCQYFRDAEDGYICLYWQGIGLLDEHSGELTVLKELISDRDSRRMNDGTVDPQGRLWAGELDVKTAAGGLGFTNKPSGRLWRYDPDGTAHVMIDGGLAISNGIGFSPDHTKLYLNDSLGQVTYAFDYDNETGSISNRRVLRDFKGSTMEPDGLVVDVEGNIWTALYNGFAVLCMSPDGSILARVELPARCVTCPTWGGAENDTLYVTTASDDSEHGGHVYKIKTRTKGMPKYKFGG